jgi:hypothetical protein
MASNSWLHVFIFLLVPAHKRDGKYVTASQKCVRIQTVVHINNGYHLQNSLQKQISNMLVYSGTEQILYKRSSINLVLACEPLINNNNVSFKNELTVIVYSKGKSTYCLVTIFCSVDNVAYYPLAPHRGLQ